jgi:diaminopimelate epimerase
MNRIAFTKAQGAGNDFLIVEGTPEHILTAPELRRRICDRRFGVGADGIAFLAIPGSAPGVDADLRLFNSDGGEAEISGNGTRCAAAYLVQKGVAQSSATIRTQAGIIKLRLVTRTSQSFQFEMAMGQPVTSAREIPFQPPEAVSEPIIGFPLPLQAGTRRATITSMGNPHCSIASNDFEWDWRACGREIENHPFFPRRTNVEFYRALNPHQIEVRFWERGVGETLSSGTGSCAAAMAAILNRQAESPVSVETQGGKLTVRWADDGIYLTGPAVIVFQGEFFSEMKC